MAVVRARPLGVHISAVRAFAAEHQPRLATMTTADVCTRIVRPLIPARGGTFLGTLPGSSASPATVYVVHCWQGRFADTVDVMEQYARERPNAYFWIDLFCRDQHTPASDLGAAWLTSELRATIEHTGNVLVVVTPWYDPLLLSRVWCLFELVCAVKRAGLLVEYRMPAEQQRMLRHNFHMGVAAVSRLLSMVTVRHAAATLPQDKLMLDAAIHDAFGVASASSAVKHSLQQWYFTLTKAVVRDAVLADAGGATPDRTLRSLGPLLVALGFAELVLPQCMTALKQCVVTYGPHDAAVADAHVQAGTLLHHTGALPAAREQLRLALAIRIAQLGPDHPATAACCASLASVCADLADWPAAESHAQQALTSFTALYGDASAEVAAVLAELAVIYLQQGPARVHRAVACAERSLALRLQLLGESDPAVPAAFILCGTALQHSDDYKRALGHFAHARQLRLDAFGANSGPVAACHVLVGHALCLQDEPHGAIAEYMAALQIYQHVSGVDSRDVARCMQHIGWAAADAHAFPDAIATLHRALDIHISLVGEQQSGTAAILLDISRVHVLAGNAPAAQVSAERAVRILNRVLGPQHSATVEAEAVLRGLDAPSLC